MNHPPLSRDWPPDPHLPPKPEPKPEPEPDTPPSLRVGLLLLVIALLVLGAPLLTWLIAALGYPWWPVIIPACLLAALVVFLVGSFLDIRSRRR